jgi:hypothetical protein
MKRRQRCFIITFMTFQTAHAVQSIQKAALSHLQSMPGFRRAAGIDAPPDFEVNFDGRQQPRKEGRLYLPRSLRFGQVIHERLAAVVFALLVLDFQSSFPIQDGIDHLGLEHGISPKNLQPVALI